MNKIIHQLLAECDKELKHLLKSGCISVRGCPNIKGTNFLEVINIQYFVKNHYSGAHNESERGKNLLVLDGTWQLEAP